MSPEPERGAPWMVYLAQCRDGSLYAGITKNLPARLAAHNSGKGAAYTRSRTPVVLIYKEQVANRSMALKREAEIKQMSRAHKLRLVARSER